MIKLENICKAFVKKNVTFHALKNISLEVERGDIYGIIGLSGAGKSTLVRCLTDLETISSGRILIDGEDITHLEGRKLQAHRKKMGMVFQHFNLFSSRTVAKNIAYPLEIAGIPSNVRYARVQELLKLVNLNDKQDAHPQELSGGEKQRVGIARALALNPSLLICDEATNALDPKSTYQILQLLKTLNSELQLTILFITHEMDVIRSICNKVAVLHQGTIIEKGTVLEVFAHPKHPVTKSLLEQQIHVLPDEFFLHRDPSKKLLRLYFNVESARQPVISQLIKHCPVEVNILLGSLDCLQNTIIGMLVIELSGTQENILLAQNFLSQNHVSYEEVFG